MEQKATKEALGNYSGMLTFGPNMKNGMVDESMVDFYLIFPVDDCGHILKGTEPLARVPKKLPNAECCHSLAKADRASNLLVPFGSLVLDDF